MTGLLQLEWQRDTAGYEIVARPHEPNATLLTAPEGIYVVRRGGNMERYEPLKVPGLYRRLAESNETPAGARDFITEFGMPDNLIGDAYRVESFYRAVRNMRKAIALAEAREWQELVWAFDISGLHGAGVGNSRVVFEYHEGDERPTFGFRPRSLLAAIWLQFAYDYSTGQDAELRRCVWCPKWFRVGPGTGHRSTAVYCSPECQKAHADAKSKEPSI